MAEFHKLWPVGQIWFTKGFCVAQGHIEYYMHPFGLRCDTDKW